MDAGLLIVGMLLLLAMITVAVGVSCGRKPSSGVDCSSSKPACIGTATATSVCRGCCAAACPAFDRRRR
jgi:hypothetical protein